MMGGMVSPGTVALVSDDLMFASRLSTTMRHAGGSAVMVTGDAVPDVAVLFVDLNTATDRRLALIGRIHAERPDLEIVGFSVLAVKPTPETARALEAEAREQLLKEADEAIYRRRNSAVEQERAIKENELNTENAIELKKRQIRETKMDADRACQLRKARNRHFNFFTCGHDQVGKLINDQNDER